MPHTVIIVDDADILRRLLVQSLGSDARLEVLAEARDGRQAIAVVQQQRPDVVLMDAAMPVMDGFTATRKLKHLYPDLPILIFTGYADDATAEQTRASGAEAFLDKTTPTEEVADLLVALASRNDIDQS